MRFVIGILCGMTFLVGCDTHRYSHAGNNDYQTSHITVENRNFMVFKEKRGDYWETVAIVEDRQR